MVHKATADARKWLGYVRRLVEALRNGWVSPQLLAEVDEELRVHDEKQRLADAELRARYALMAETAKDRKRKRRRDNGGVA